MKTQLYSLLKFAIGWPLSLLAFVFIGKIIYDQAPAVLGDIHSVNPFLLIAGLACFLIFYFLRSFLWYRIIKGYGHAISYKESSYMWSISELKRYIPGNIWSFLGRAVLFSKHGVKKKEIGSGLIIEAELFVLGSVIVSLLSLPFLVPNYSELLGQIALALVTCIVLVYVFNRKLLEFVIARKNDEAISSSGGLPRSARNDVVSKIRSTVLFLFPPFSIAENFLLVLVSSVALFFFGLGNYLVMSAAFGTDPQLLWQLVGVFVLAFVAGYLSIVTPAGFGVREGITIYALLKIVPSGLAAFAALFTRLILIIAELLFILLCYLWFKSRNKRVARVEKWLAKHPYESVVAAMSFVYAVYFSIASFLRYEHYYTGRFDLGNMVQTVWNTLHGNFFMMTNPDGIEQVSRLAFHADFILILIAPFYALWQDPKMLLLIQSVVVAAGAIFVYLIGQEVLKNKNISLVLAFAYLINPGVQRANMYDFHAVVLATTFLLATFYFLLKKKYGLFILFAVLSAICKEQIWLIIGLFGLLTIIMHRKWLFGSAIFLLSVGMFFVLIEYAIPNSLGANHFALEYYSDFGSSPIDIVKSIILSPDKVIQTAMEPERMRFIQQIFSPLGYLSYAFPFFLIFAGPDLLISILSSNSNLHQIYYQYTATMTPFIFISAIYGCWVILKLAGKVSLSIRSTVPVLLMLYILYSALSAAYAFGPLPGSKEPNIAMFTKPFPDKDLIDEVISRIPPEARVSASNNLGSHLSQREFIYVLPYATDSADMVLISDKDGYAEVTTNALEANLLYRKVIDKDGFIVFEKTF